MEIVNKNINELIKYNKNPRNNENAIYEVAKSIKEFGFKVPIIIDENNIIVCGHTRYEASKLLNLKKIPCIIVKDLNEEQIKAFRLADNKVSEQASWNYDLLDLELDDITELDMEDFGFIEHTIDWSSIDEISEENYEKPESEKLRCPLCNGVDEKIRFVKVS